MMPPGAAESRGAQKAALAGVIYDKKTDAETGALLDALKGQVRPDPRGRAGQGAAPPLQARRGEAAPRRRCGAQPSAASAAAWLRQAGRGAKQRRRA